MAGNAAFKLDTVALALGGERMGDCKELEGCFEWFDGCCCATGRLVVCSFAGASASSESVSSSMRSITTAFDGLAVEAVFKIGVCILEAGVVTVARTEWWPDNPSAMIESLISMGS